MPELFPLSRAQQRIWYNEVVHPGTSFATLGFSLDLPDAEENTLCSVERLLREIVAKNDALRARFVRTGEDPYADVRQYFDRPSEMLRLPRITRQHHGDVLEFMQRDSNTPFPLDNETLWKAFFLVHGDNKAVLYFRAHHLIVDGISINLIGRAVLDLFHGGGNEEIVTLLESGSRYGSFLDAEEQYLRSPRFEKDREFWTKTLNDAPEMTLIADRSVESDDFHCDSRDWIADDRLAERTEEFCRITGTNPFRLFTLLFHLVVSRWSRADDTVFHIPFSNRGAVGRAAVGMCVETVPIRFSGLASLSLREAMDRMGKNLIRCLSHGKFPYQEIVASLRASGDYSGPLALVSISDLTTAERGEHSDGATFRHGDDGAEPITIYVNPGVRAGEGLRRVHFRFRDGIFSPERIENLVECFRHALEYCLKNPETRLNEIPLTSPEYRQTVLDCWNATDVSYERPDDYPSFFREAARRFPDEKAVVFGDTVYSYRKLDDASDRLAGALRKRGIGRGSFVPILLPRCAEILVAEIGVMKSGAAFVPIDPDYPSRRIEQMIENCSASIVLDMETLNTLQKEENPAPDFEPVVGNDLAYVLYTSGSTGTPKGVLIEHAGLVNLIRGKCRVHGIDRTDRVAVCHSFAFDVSVFHLLAGPTQGAEIHILNDYCRKDVDILGRYLRDHSITRLHLPTKFGEIFSASPQSETLKTLWLGGEALTKPCPVGNTAVYNSYGPTEVTIHATECRVDDFAASSFPIGRPLDNIRAYILDESDLLCPLGMPGELCLSGIQVARGYLGLDEMSAEKFVANPLFRADRDPAPHARMYRTGDLAFRLPDGRIEFVGRRDAQVKIRGFRIEPGDIESALSANPALSAACVIVRPDQGGQPVLIAYYVPKILGDSEVDETSLRSRLSEQLPSYMIPSYFVRLEEMPISTNGKIDRRRLPDPSWSDRQHDYVPPATEIETLLVDIWREILGSESVGVRDNFFVLGGDSIKAIQVQARLRAAGFGLSTIDLFHHPTIRELAPRTQTLRIKAEQGPIVGDISLTPIQRRFFAHSDRQNQFHQSIRLAFRRNSRIDPEMLNTVLRALVEKHDMLRAAYPYDSEYPFGRRQSVRNVDSDALFEIRFIENETEISEVQSSVDITTGPLLYALIRRVETAEELWLVAHHLVVDGVSWRILIEDLNTAYQQLESGRPIFLPPKSDSFRRWSEAVEVYAGKPSLLREFPFWKRCLDQCSQAIPLPISRTLPSGQRRTGQIELLCVETDDNRLRQACAAYHGEMNDLLLAVLVRAVARWSGVEERSESPVAVTLEGHGREPVVGPLDLSRTVGWFTSTFPVVFSIADDPGRQIVAVKETLRRLPHKGIGFDVLRFMTDRLPTPTNPPSILFNYLGRFESGNGTTETAFTPLGFGTGADVDPEYPIRQPLTCNALTLDETLRFEFAWHPAEFERSEIDRFGTIFKETVDEIAEHCLALEKPVRTPSDFGDATLSLEELDAILTEYPEDEIERITSLTPMQEGMLFHSQVVGAASAYFQQSLAEIRGPLNVTELQRRLDETVRRHQMLRCACLYENIDSPRLVALRSRKARFRFENLERLSEDEQNATIRTFMLQARECGLDVRKDPLLGLAVFAVGPNRFRLVVDFHHLIMDRWALGVLFEELLGEKSNPEDAAPLPFHEYVDWFLARDRDDDLAWWNIRLAGVEEQTDLPGKLPIADDESEPSQLSFDFGVDIMERIDRLAHERQVTPNVVLQTAWGLLLQIYNNRRDVVFGGVVSGRTPELPGCDRLIGMCVNTIPVRVACKAETTFASLLDEMQRESLESENRAFCSLSDLFKMTSVGSGLISHLFVMENIHLADSTGPDRPTLTPLEHFSRTNYDLSIVLEPTGTLRGFFGYNAAAFERSQIERFRDHYRTLLDTVLSEPEIAVSEIDLLVGEERQTVLERFNATETIFDDGLEGETYPELFRRVAEKFADHRAVFFEPDDGDDDLRCSLTYEELDQASDRLAALLRAEGIGPETIVPLLLPRCAQFPVCALGVMKTGGAYLPIDPNYPSERIDYMLGDSGATILLSFPELQDRCTTFTGRRIDVPRSNSSEKWFVGLELTDKKVGSGASGIAYQIYTSGSTGNPKGVMLEHAGLINLIRAKNRVHRFNTEDRVAVFHSFSFDVSVFHLFAGLLFGAEIHVLSEHRRRDVDALNDYVRRHDITRIHLPTRVGELFCETPHSAPLRTIWLGGEALKRVSAQNAEVWNSYGPTETTIHITEYHVENFGDRNFPIGRPMDNSKAYILGLGDKPCPIAVPGELCFAGIQVGRGYRNNPETTAAKFVDNPFFDSGRHDTSYRKMYRTGDICCWTPDGTIRFVGRNDFQVKIRGFRVEPGEVEELLNTVPIIDESAVVARKGPHDAYYLTAYYTPAEKLPDEGPEKKEQRRQTLGRCLSYFLPDFMVPQYLVELDTMPRTLTGKVDRSMLPPPELEIAREHRAAETPEQREIATVWSELFDVDDPDIETDFFAAGGHSLLAMRLLSRMKSKLGLHLSIADLYGGATISSLADILKKSRVSGSSQPFRSHWIHSEAAAPPLIFLPPFMGLGLCYMPLLKHFGKVHPLLLLNQHGHEVGQTPDLTLTTIAERFAADILELHDDRPCYLVGWSLGGLFAYETIRHLSRRGRRVLGLIAVDTHMEFSRRSRDLFERLCDDRLSEFDEEEQRLFSCVLDGLEPLWKDDPLYKIRLRHLVKHNLAAHEEYVAHPLPEPTPMLLIQASRETPGMGGKNLPTALNAWESLGLSPQRHVVDADHFTVVTDPCCASVAEMIMNFTSTPR